MPPPFTVRADAGPSACLFDESQTRFIGLSEDGNLLHASGDDPQVLLKPVVPIPAGWCIVELRLEGDVREPKVYFDFGEGLSEAWTATLEWDPGRRAHRVICWVPSPVLAMRVDPSDRSARFRLQSFIVDSPNLWEVSRLLAERETGPDSRAQPRRDLRRSHRLLLEDGVNAQVVTCRSSHFSGLSLELNPAYARETDITLEVYEFEPAGPRLVRTARVDIANVNGTELEHIYWAPMENSAGRTYLARLVAFRNGEPVSLSRARVLRRARVINSSPEPNQELPEAVAFSPVTQCNLNCTHCISQPTRTRFAEASDGIWDEVRAVTRMPAFSNLSTDYSGDILFNEVRHGGWLSRIIALDVPYRIDTNAICLDDPIADKLFASRLSEINFSLDSMDPAIYPTIRRGCIPLPEVLAKIARFMERKRAAGAHFNTLMSFVLMRSNAGTIRPAFAFAREHGIAAVSIVSLIAFTEDMVDELFIWDQDAYRALYEELSEEAARHEIALNMQPPIARWRDRDGHAPCYAAHGTALILGNGDVMACCVPGTRIGNLHEQSLRELWNGPAYRAFRARVNSDNPPDTCRNCPMIRLADNRKAYAPVRYGPRIAPVAVARPSRAARADRG